MTCLLSSAQLNLTVQRLAHQLIESESHLDEVVFIGIQPRGSMLADRLLDVVRLLRASDSIQHGVLDITFYRDDFREEIRVPAETRLMHSIEGKRVVLIDDVLYTGRTIRAALDALQDFGRPRQVELCVLVDRRFNRELPIQPDYYGVAIDTQSKEKVRVDWHRSSVFVYGEGEKV
jgi:pyrimidine operon attenuation protein/uracil phosphoribosyltransferase